MRISAALRNPSDRVVTAPLLATCGFGLALMALFALYPLIPREWDCFYAWRVYIENWESGGLGQALLHAVSGGKYPTYPLLIRAVMHLEGVSFLAALRSTRLLCLLLSWTGCALMLLKTGFPRLNAFATATLLHLNPMFLRIVTQNLQDAPKIGLFFYCALFFLSFMEAREGGKSPWLALLAFDVCGALLGMVRPVDLFPLFFFMVAYSLPRRRAPDAARLLAPLLAFLLGLHAYGHSVTGAWGFSAGEKPQVWALSYLDWLAAGFRQSHSLLKTLEHALAAPLNHAINRLYYLVDDYVFQANDLRMLELYRFVPHLALRGSLVERGLKLSLAAALAFLVVQSLLQDRRRMSLSACFLWAGVGGFLFWTFGFNHYEPRYWVLVILGWGLGLALEALREARALPFLLAANGLLGIALATTLPGRLTASAERAWAFQSWQSAVRPYCGRDVAFVLPSQQFKWTAFEFAAKQACPKAQVYFESSGEATDFEGRKLAAELRTVRFTARQLEPDAMF